MKSITLIYDPSYGQSLPDARIISSVNSFMDVFKRDGYFKSTFGNFSIIEEFIRQAVAQDIPLETISILYRIGSKEMKIDTGSTVS